MHATNGITILTLKHTCSGSPSPLLSQEIIPHRNADSQTDKEYLNLSGKQIHCKVYTYDEYSRELRVQLYEKSEIGWQNFHSLFSGGKVFPTCPTSAGECLFRSFVIPTTTAYILYFWMPFVVGFLLLPLWRCLNEIKLNSIKSSFCFFL